MIMSYVGTSGATVFNTLVYMSGITAAIPYAFSALAQIKWRLVDHRELHTPRFVRDVGVAVVAPGLLGALHLVLAQHRRGHLVRGVPAVHYGRRRRSSLGIPVYLAQRTSMTEPAAVPAWRP